MDATTIGAEAAVEAGDEYFSMSETRWFDCGRTNVGHRSGAGRWIAWASTGGIGERVRAVGGGFLPGVGAFVTTGQRGNTPTNRNGRLSARRPGAGRRLSNVVVV